MRGIIRAGGYGTRLYPSTRAVSKHLFPVYDKPAICYPVSLLVSAGITEFMISVLRKNRPAYEELLGDGSRFGISIRYLEENGTVPLAKNLLECRDFIGTQPVAVALGDNVFVGEGFPRQVRRAAERFETSGGACVFCKAVDDPRDFGVVEYGAGGQILSLESKPPDPKSNYAVTGLFFFDRDVSETIGRTKHTESGDVIFADLLRQYLREGRLRSEILGDGVRWYDTGTPERLYQASGAVRAYQQEHASFTGSIADAAFDAGLIGPGQLAALSDGMQMTEYGKHLAQRAAGSRS